VASDLFGEAQRCRAEFVRQRAMYTNTTPVFPGAKSWPVFCRAAETAREHGLIPEIFVAVVMERAAADGFFWPHALGSDRYVTQGLAGIKVRAHHRLGLYRAQLDRFTALLMFGSAASILRAYGQEFVPLLRFVMATKFSVSDVADSSRDAACHELLIHPEAREAFGSLVEALQ